MIETPSYAARRSGSARVSHACCASRNNAELPPRSGCTCFNARRYAVLISATLAEGATSSTSYRSPAGRPPAARRPPAGRCTLCHAVLRRRARVRPEDARDLRRAPRPASGLVDNSLDRRGCGQWRHGTPRRRPRGRQLGCGDQTAQVNGPRGRRLRARQGVEGPQIRQPRHEGRRVCGHFANTSASSAGCSASNVAAGTSPASTSRPPTASTSPSTAAATNSPPFTPLSPRTSCPPGSQGRLQPPLNEDSTLCRDGTPHRRPAGASRHGDPRRQRPDRVDTATTRRVRRMLQESVRLPRDCELLRAPSDVGVDALRLESFVRYGVAGWSR
jgi:hypothetical protein